MVLLFGNEVCGNIKIEAAFLCVVCDLYHAFFKAMLGGNTMKIKIVGMITAMAMLISVMPQIMVNAADDITISNLSELEVFRDDVNSGNTYEGKTVTLTADIDMSEKYGEGKELWESIGTEEHSFNGTFTGTGHTLNVCIHTGDTDGIIGGLFGYTDENAVIANLAVSGSVWVNGTIHMGNWHGVPGYVGAIVGKNKGIIQNCCNTADVTYTGNNGFTGGIAGKTEGLIMNCYNTGNIKMMSYSGSNISETDDNSLIQNCFYLSESEMSDGKGAYGKMEDQFMSGEVAYLLNNQKSEGNLAWYQNICEDDFPVLDNTHSVVMANEWGYCNKSISPSVACAYVAQVSPLTNEVRTKVNSYSELIDLFATNSFLAKKYNEAFFENNYLFIYYIDKGSSGNLYSAPNISESSSGIEIKINKEYSGDADDIVEWYLLCELDRAFSEKTISVTLTKFGKNVNVEYPYQINGLRITNTAGEVIEKIQNNTGFIVEADITKTEERNEKDYLFVAVYDTDGALISLDYVKAKFAVDGKCSFGFSIPPQEKSVGSVKAFVWNTFNSMEPLAENKTLYLGK